MNPARAASSWYKPHALPALTFLSLTFPLSLSPPLLMVASSCGKELELPFFGTVGQLDLFLSCLVEMNASDASVIWGRVVTQNENTHI